MDRIRALLPPREVNLVIFHGRCTDGSAAAGCAYLFSQTHGIANVQYYAAQHAPPDEPLDATLLALLTPNARVAIFDFSFPRDLLLQIRSRVAALVLLDHHQSAADCLADLKCCYFDMTRSGAVLAWIYFFGERIPVPRVLQYIEQQDLLLSDRSDNSRNFTRAFYALVRTDQPHVFTRYLRRVGDHWIDDATQLEWFIERGRLLREYVDACVAERVANACTLLTHDGSLRVAIVNTDFCVSETGAALAQTHDYALLFATRLTASDRTGYVMSIKVSLRSSNAATRPCHTVAAKYGGGGHACAAAFVWRGEFSTLLDSVRKWSASLDTVIAPISH